ncbi:MAG: PorV/PorQ family protein [Chlorobi bacterium]|nr:PorV/PorQ family protein [Chlorobiota bacterium]
MQKPILFILLFLSTFGVNAQNETKNPIPVIFPALANINNAQSFGFGQINAVSGSNYPQNAGEGNPALLANRKYNLGVYITGPLFLDRFKLLDGNIIISNHPNNYFAFHYNLIELKTDFKNHKPNVVIKTSRFDRLSSFDFTYGHLINLNLAWGIDLKFARPVALIGVKNDNPVIIDENNVVALNLGFNYKKDFQINKKNWQYETGLYISNIGARVDSVINDNYPLSFLPTTLHFGNLLKYKSNVVRRSNIEALFAYQVEKLLVPTPPETEFINGQREIIRGKSPDVNIWKGMFQSFYDAPNGFNEEIHELVHKAGIEMRFTYNRMFQMALRIGGVYENETKGDRRFFTFGVRAGFYGFYFDYAKLPGYTKEFNRFNIGYITHFPDTKFRFAE